MDSRGGSFGLALLLASALPAVAAGQSPSTASATTLQALTTYPGFYHLKTVVVRGDRDVQGGQPRLVPRGGVERGVRLIFRDQRPAAGPLEVRGTFWDVGRFPAEDPAVAGVDIKQYAESVLGDRWPARGELLVLYVAGTLAVPPPPPGPPRIRQLALEPERYEGQTVTLRGQFGGRNLLGDLPQAPRVSRFDFVVRAGGGAVWVTGQAPKGHGWNLGIESKMDTAKWVEVTGTVRQGNGLVWVEAAAVNQAKPEADAPTEPQGPPPAVPPAAAPEVTFSLPAEGETDVPPETTVQFQVSRDLDPDTLPGHLAATYMGESSGTPIPLKAAFDRATRVLTLTFEKPLERFRTVVVEVSDALRGTDGQPMKKHRLTFSVGG